jgi:hypothetical protein
MGRAAWREMMQAWIDAVPTYHYRILHGDLEKPGALGLTNTVITEFEVTETNAAGVTRVGWGIDVSEMRRGKLVAGRAYMFDPAAEEAFLVSAEPFEPGHHDIRVEGVDLHEECPSPRLLGGDERRARAGGRVEDRPARRSDEYSIACRASSTGFSVRLVVARRHPGGDGVVRAWLDPDAL